MSSTDSNSPAPVAGADNGAVNFVRGLAGALLGGIAGYFVFAWIARQGIYAPVVPGGLVGFGASALLKRSSLPLAVACGVLALGVGLYSECRVVPFIADPSLGYFLTHLQDLRPITQIALVAGGVLGFWIPFRTRP
jgi:hypothetical protein